MVGSCRPSTCAAQLLLPRWVHFFVSVSVFVCAYVFIPFCGHINSGDRVYSTIYIYIYKCVYLFCTTSQAGCDAPWIVVLCTSSCGVFVMVRFVCAQFQQSERDERFRVVCVCVCVRVMFKIMTQFSVGAFVYDLRYNTISILYMPYNI